MNENICERKAIAYGRESLGDQGSTSFLVK